MDKEQSFQQMVLGQLDIHMQKREQSWTSSLHHMQKLFKMDQSPNCKSSNYLNALKKHKRKSWWS